VCPGTPSASLFMDNPFGAPSMTILWVILLFSYYIAVCEGRGRGSLNRLSTSKAWESGVCKAIKRSFWDQRVAEATKSKAGCVILSFMVWLSMLWAIQHVVKLPIRHVQDQKQNWHDPFPAECVV
jgi:Ni,Fe-hydrogenase I cytochrome b subunit